MTRTIWAKVRPHLLSWHIIPRLAMIVIAVGAAILTGCMLMMVVMTAMMGGHNRAQANTEARHRWSLR